MSDLTGQIGLVPHPHTPVEFAIEWWTRAPVHHAVLAVDEEQCVSCEPGGARLRPITIYPDAYWSHFTLTDTQRQAIIADANGMLGIPYGWWADAAIALARRTPFRVPLWLAQYIESDRRSECAQLCDKVYADAGIHLFTKVLPSAVDPGMFVPLWRKRKWMPAQ